MNTYKLPAYKYHILSSISVHDVKGQTRRGKTHRYHVANKYFFDIATAGRRSKVRKGGSPDLTRSGPVGRCCGLWVGGCCGLVVLCAGKPIWHVLTSTLLMLPTKYLIKVRRLTHQIWESAAAWRAGRRTATGRRPRPRPGAGAGLAAGGPEGVPAGCGVPHRRARSARAGAGRRAAGRARWRWATSRWRRTDYAGTSWTSD